MRSNSEIKLRFSDFDMAGHVHNGKYLCFFEQGRIHFLTQISGSDWNWKKQGIVLGRNELDYIKPIYLKDTIYIVTKCEHVGNKSFTLSYELFKKSNKEDTLCAKGKSLLVCMNFETEETMPIYEAWKQPLMESLKS